MIIPWEIRYSPTHLQKLALMLAANGQGMKMWFIIQTLPLLYLHFYMGRVYLMTSQQICIHFDKISACCRTHTHQFCVMMLLPWGCLWNYKSSLFSSDWIRYGRKKRGGKQTKPFWSGYPSRLFWGKVPFCRGWKASILFWRPWLFWGHKVGASYSYGLEKYLSLRCVVLKFPASITMLPGNMVTSNIWEHQVEEGWPIIFRLLFFPPIKVRTEHNEASNVFP